MSRPLVGSFKEVISGLVMSSAPTAVRLRSPPEMPLISSLPTMVSAHFVRLMPRSRSSIRLSLDSPEFCLSRSLAENRRTSRGVIVPNKASFCMT